MDAIRSRNQYRFLSLITKLVAESTGEERSFWLRTQDAYLVQACAESYEFDSAWDHLESVSQTATGDPITQEAVLLLALAMLYVSEDARRYQAIRANLRSLPLESRTTWKMLKARGLVCLQKGYWVRGRNLHARAIAALAAEPEEVLKRNRGYFIHMYAAYAMGCFATGLPDLAEASVRNAEAMMTDVRRQYVDPLSLARAQAELHLYRSEFQEARTVLQSARAWTEARQGRLVIPDQVSLLMLVARIARAENNQEGFRHFCDQALALCRQYHLPFSEARVNTLLAGAER
jgi:hypothetical protein